MVRVYLLAFASLFIAALASAQVPIIETDAEYAVIMDHDTGAVLYSKDGDTPMIPASMTKMMTVQVVFERLKTGEIALTDTFPTSENAWRKGGFASGGSTMGLAISDEPTVEELIRGVVVLSGNDACIVLAEGLAGSEEAFAAEMTALAQELGLTSATFKNVTGLDDEGHRISALDLARLAKIQIDQFPDMYAYYNEEAYEWRGIRQPNRNPLLGKNGVDGLKTGHLGISGYGLTASAERDGKRRIIVLNGLPSERARAQEADRMMRMAFTAFDTRTIAANGKILAEVPVALGTQTKVGLTLVDPVVVSAHKRAFPRAVTEIVYDAPLRAPIAKGDPIAKMVITMEGNTPVEAPLVATESIGKLGFFGKAIAGLSAMMEPTDG